MNRFVIVDGLPYLLANGKTYSVRWDEQGFTVGAEVELASVPVITHSERAIKAKCAACLDSIGNTNPENEDDGNTNPENEDDGNTNPDEATNLEKWTVAELKAYAADHGIDLGDAKKKNEIINAIQKAGV